MNRKGESTFIITLFAIGFFIILSISFAAGELTGYRDGQIDYAKGKIKYHQVN